MKVSSVGDVVDGRGQLSTRTVHLDFVVNFFIAVLCTSLCCSSDCPIFLVLAATA